MYKANFISTSAKKSLLLVTAHVCLGFIFGGGMWQASAFAGTFQQVLPSVQKILNEPVKIRIQGYRTQVEFTPDEKAKQLSVTVKKMVTAKDQAKADEYFRSWNLRTSDQGNILQLEVASALDKNSWKPLLKDLGEDVPLFVFDVRGPSQAIEVTSKNLQMKIKSLKSGIKVSSQKVDFKSDSTEGDMQVSVESGVVNIGSHKGKLHLDSFSAEVKLKEVDGALEVSNFSGGTHVTQSSADSILRTNSGVMNVDDLKGNVDFTNGRGVVKLQDIDGSVKGANGSGNINIQSKTKAEVRLQSNEGNIVIRVPQTSGAYVNIFNKEGNIVAPDSLQIRSEPDQKVATGQLKGTLPGVVKVNAKSGIVRLSVY